MDEQLKSIQKYAETYQTLDDAGALALINALLDRDAKMTALRQHWLGEFQKVVPTRIAARVVQIDRRLSNLAQLEICLRYLWFTKWRPHLLEDCAQPPDPVRRWLKNSVGSESRSSQDLEPSPTSCTRMSPKPHHRP